MALSGGPAHYFDSVSRAAMTLLRIYLLHIHTLMLNGLVPIEMLGAFRGSLFRSAHYPV